MPPEFTKEELDLLSPEERAGLLDPDLIDEGEGEVVDLDAAVTAAIEANKTAFPDPVPVPEPQPEEDADPDAAPAEQAPAPEPAPAAEPAAAAPAPRAAPPAPDFDAAIKTAKDSLLDLARKFDSGELLAEEYEAQRIDLSVELTVLAGDKRAFERDAARAVADVEDTWGGTTVPKWLEDPANAIYKPGSVALDALDMQVRQLQGEVLAAGGNQYDPALLDKADAKIRADFGLPPRAGAKTPAAPPKPDPLKVTERAEAPPSLAKVPAADNNDDISAAGRFAYLDRMDAISREKAMERMSAADLDAYLHAD